MFCRTVFSSNTPAVELYRTGLLGISNSPTSAFCTWFNSNNDGFRDLIVALPRETTLIEKIRARIARRIGEDWQVWISQNPFLFTLHGVTMGHPFFRPGIWDLSLYSAIPGDQHWLEVALAAQGQIDPRLAPRFECAPRRRHRSCPSGMPKAQSDPQGTIASISAWEMKPVRRAWK